MPLYRIERQVVEPEQDMPIGHGLFLERQHVADFPLRSSLSRQTRLTSAMWWLVSGSKVGDASIPPRWWPAGSRPQEVVADEEEGVPTRRSVSSVSTSRRCCRCWQRGASSRST